MQAQTHRAALSSLSGALPCPEEAAVPRPRASLPLRPVGAPGLRRPAFSVPGTVPFTDAAQAWFWTVAALAARRDGTGGGGGRIQRPCDPDDVIRALDLLYRRGGIGPAHARVLRRWGERFVAPPGHPVAEHGDGLLWTEAMAQLDGVLRAKGIVA